MKGNVKTKPKIHCNEGCQQPDTVIETKYPELLGKYGYLRRDYLREHRQEAHTKMLLTGELNCHLLKIDEQAYDFFNRLMVQMMKVESVTEVPKNQNQLEWV